MKKKNRRNYESIWKFDGFLFSLVSHGTQNKSTFFAISIWYNYYERNVGKKSSLVFYINKWIKESTSLFFAKHIIKNGQQQNNWRIKYILCNYKTTNKKNRKLNCTSARIVSIKKLILGLLKKDWREKREINNLTNLNLQLMIIWKKNKRNRERTLTKMIWSWQTSRKCSWEVDDVGRWRWSKI